MPPKSSFLDKVLGRIWRVSMLKGWCVVQRLASERSFLETLFNTIEDGVLSRMKTGRILYFNEAVTQLIGLKSPKRFRRAAYHPNICPKLDWPKLLTTAARWPARRAARV